MIRQPRPRSARWLSTSIPEAQWHSSLARTCSAEYHVNNLVSPVLFQEALRHVPDNAVVLEIGPHALLQVRAGRPAGGAGGAAGAWPAPGPVGNARPGCAPCRPS